MPRTDIHLDAMLRHRGAAYYESLHGRATRADVTRALDTVEEHLHEQARRPSSGAAGSIRHAADKPTLTGSLDPSTGPHADLIPLAIRLMWNVDGVVDVIDRLGAARPTGPRDEIRELLPQLARKGDQDR